MQVDKKPGHRLAEVRDMKDAWDILGKICFFCEGFLDSSTCKLSSLGMRETAGTIFLPSPSA